MIPVVITKEQLKLMLRELRSSCSNDSLYKKGEDIEKIQDSYLSTIKVSGERINRVDKTRMLVVKYLNDKNEIFTVNLNILLVYKHVPEIAMKQ